jgi:MraZ protein
MFRGAAKVTIDDKGRVVVPTRYRDELAAPAAGRVFVVGDREGCLLIYPAPEWERYEEGLDDDPRLPLEERRVNRNLLANAEEVSLDSHGRLALTPAQRDFAGLSRSALVVGVRKHLELWDEGRWKAQQEQWRQAALGAPSAPAAGTSSSQ